MSSKERSKSAIYYNFQRDHAKEWHESMLKIFNLPDLKEVKVEYTAIPKSDTVSRRETFRIHASWTKLRATEGHGSYSVKVPYSGEEMVINYNIIPIKKP